MLALLSPPVRRWLLATLLLPLIAFALSKVGLYLQRRNDGAPTRLSRALLSVSAFARRRSNRGDDDTDSLTTRDQRPRQSHRPPRRPTPPPHSGEHTQLSRSDQLHDSQLHDKARPLLAGTNHGLKTRRGEGHSRKRGPRSFLAESCWTVRTLSLGNSAKEAVCSRLADHDAPRRRRARLRIPAVIVLSAINV